MQISSGNYLDIQSSSPLKFPTIYASVLPVIRPHVGANSELLASSDVTDK